MPASIIRFTALRPAPPTPTTWIFARYDPSCPARAWCSRGAGSSIGSTYRVTGGSGMYAGGGVGSGIGSGAGGRGVGSGIDGSGTGSGRGGTGVSTSSSQVGTCSTVDSCGSSGGASGAPCSCCRCAASVALKSSASGPSRMLARFRAIEHLLRKITVELGGVAGRPVPQDGLAFHGGLGVPDRLADLRLEDEVAEVLLEDVDRFLRVQQALVVHRRQDPLDCYVRVQVFADHGQSVLQLDQSAQGEVLALDGDDHAVRRDERVDRQQPERRRSVDEDVVVLRLDADERLLER